MGMEGKKAFRQKHKIAAKLNALTLNSGGTATADVLKVSLMPLLGRLVTFLLTAVVPAASGLSIKLIGRKLSDGNWEVVTDKAAADIAIAAGKLGDGQAIETDGIMATVDVEDFKAKYSEIGLRAANSAATDVVPSGVALVSDLFSEPSNQVDEFDSVVWS